MDRFNFAATLNKCQPVVAIWPTYLRAINTQQRVLCIPSLSAEQFAFCNVKNGESRRRFSRFRRQNDSRKLSPSRMARFFVSYLRLSAVVHSIWLTFSTRRIILSLTDNITSVIVYLWGIFEFCWVTVTSNIKFM